MESDNYFKKAEEYVKNVRKAIIRDYEQVPPEWCAQLQQLEDLYVMYLKAAEVARRDDPVTYTNNGKTATPNPYFGVMVTAMGSMDKIIKSFGLSPVSQKKLKGNSTLANSDEDECDEL